MKITNNVLLFCFTFTAMSRLVALLLLITFVIQTFEGTFLVIDYYVNTGSFAKNCENKFKPQMHCNGKCVLMRKIKDQKKNEQGPAPEIKYLVKMDLLSPKSSLSLDFAAAANNSRQHFVASNSGSVIDHPSSIFHPPPAHC
jgi:hypothetical protein